MAKWLRSTPALLLLWALFAAAPGLQARETAAREPPATLMDMIEESGSSGVAFMIVLGLFSLAGLAVILERLVNLTHGKIIPAAFLHELDGLAKQRESNVERFRDLCEGFRLTEKSLAALHKAEVPQSVLTRLRSVTGPALSAKEFLEQLKKTLAAEDFERYQAKLLEQAEGCGRFAAPIALVLRAGLLRAGRPVAEVEKSMEDALAREVAALRSRVRPLNVIGAVAPLVGLFGTVIGMILAFRTASVEGLGGRAELLAEGIYLALLTTAAGLTIAIPCLLFAAYFNDRIDKFMREMDERLMTTIPCFARMEGNAGGQTVPAERLLAVQG